MYKEVVMSVGYGSNFKLAKLSSEEVGKEEIQRSSLGGILNIISIIGEIIGSIAFPELAPIIAVGAAGTRVGIEAATGEQISPLGTTIDFAGGIIPGIGMGIKNLKMFGIVSEQLGGLYSSAARQAEFYEGLGNNLQISANKAANLAGPHHTLAEAFSMAHQTITKSGGDFFRTASMVSDRLGGQISEGMRNGYMVADFLGYRTSFEAYRSALSNTLEMEGLKGLSVGEKAAGVGSGAVFGTTEDVIQTAREAGLSEEFIRELLAYEAEGLSYKSIRSIFIDELIRQVGRQEALRIIRSLPEAQDTIRRMMEFELTKEERRGFLGGLNYAVKHPVKWAGSSQGNTVLQWVQNIFDGNDLGRFLVEKPYSMIKEEIDKVFKGLKPVIKNAEKVEDAWEKTGGVLVDSQVILGYKVIQESKNPLGHNLIMIKFYPEPTKGKKPVFVRATATQLEQLATKGMRYYQKTWAVSKGGRRGNTFLNIPPQLRFMMNSTTSFLPVGALRWFESLSSNIVGSFLQHSAKDGYSFKWTGIGSSEYTDKIGKTVGHTFANRVSRMFTRVIAGGYAKYRIGSKSPIAKFIGSELQRFSGAGVNTAFDISGMTGRSRLTAGQIATRNFRTAGLQGVKGATSYTNRRLASGSTGLGSSYIRQSIGTRRSLNIYQRPLSSLSGGGARLTSFGKFKI